jgi:hypothetical protein
MTIVSEIMALHHGSVTIHSEKGVGTTNDASSRVELDNLHGRAGSDRPDQPDGVHSFTGLAQQFSA